MNLCNLGITLVEQGMYEDARLVAEEGRAACEEVQDKNGQVGMHCLFATIEAGLQERASAEEHLQKAFALVEAGHRATDLSLSLTRAYVSTLLLSKHWDEHTHAEIQGLLHQARTAQEDDVDPGEPVLLRDRSAEIRHSIEVIERILLAYA